MNSSPNLCSSCLLQTGQRTKPAFKGLSLRAVAVEGPASPLGFEVLESTASALRFLRDEVKDDRPKSC
jgi:hypothetical protein